MIKNWLRRSQKDDLINLTFKMSISGFIMFFITQMKELVNYIEDTDYDENIKQFLIQSFLLEYKMEQDGIIHYRKDYDKLIDSFIE